MILLIRILKFSAFKILSIVKKKQTKIEPRNGSYAISALMGLITWIVPMQKEEVMYFSLSNFS